MGLSPRHPKQNLTGKQIEMPQTLSQTSRNVIDTRQIRRVFVLREARGKSDFIVKNLVKSNSCLYNTATGYRLQATGYSNKHTG
jgi:hypothetical protein